MVTEKRSYCTAVVVREVDPSHADTVELASFEAVVSFLRQTYAWFANLIADRRADEDQPGEPESIVGFGVALTNRWSSEVEVGVGRDIWFLFRHHPRPSRCFSDNPPMD